MSAVHHRRYFAGLASLLLLGVAAVPASGNVADLVTARGHDDTATSAEPIADDTYAIVTFRDLPAASHPGTKPAPGDRLNPRAAEVRSYVAELRRSQREFRDWLSAKHPRSGVLEDFQLVANAVVVERDGVSMRALRNGPGVTDVQPAGRYEPTMNTSADLINAPALWDAFDGGRAGAGAGVDVAVIDSGVDYSHPAFGCKDTSTVVSRLYYTGELPDDVLARGPAPEPGAPEDMHNSHGTHVAGTIAGCVLDLGELLGPIATGETWSGIAPAANVHNYNVFPARGVGYAFGGGTAYSHDIALALEDAVADGMDVVNMSLGGGQQGPNDLLEEAANSTVDAGVTVVTSAGNSGPGRATVGSPGTAELVISVAASTNRQILGVDVSVGGASYTGAVGDFGPAAETAGELVDWASVSGGDRLACAAIPAGSFDSGQLAFVQRGACSFTTKVRNAENAGASGAVVVNNVAGPPTAMAHDGTSPFPAIPAVMVGSADDAMIRDGLPASATLAAADAATLIKDDGFANVIAGFSSRGPTTFGARLKPEITAPGVNVLSSVFQSGFAFFSGTSMSSPHIAGSAAALLALHPDWSPADVKSALVNTADPTAVTDHVTGMDDPGVLTRGAGLADLGAAMAPPVTLEPSTVGFGSWRGSRSVADEREIVVHNITAGTVTCDLGLSGDTAIVGLSATQVTVGAGESATVAVALDAGGKNATPSGDYDGDVTVDCGADGSVHAPWWVNIDRAG